MANLKQIVAVGVLGIALILGAVAYSIFKTPATASGPITAIPLATGDTGASAPEATSQPDVTADAAAPTRAAAAAGPATSAATAALPSGPVTLQISQAESQARFRIDEVLNGQPNTVVGTTNQVAGEIAVDPSDPTKIRVGTIQINARTLTTDSGMRNRMINNRILQTGQYEFITFTPTSLTGLPRQAAVGQDFTFQMVGNLKIRDVTKEVTFDVTAKAASATRLQGTARATIRYADYGIAIPQVPQVASVADQVRLELDFVAVAK